MLHPHALLIAALLAGGSRGFAWDGGSAPPPSPPHRRSLALLSGGRPLPSGSHLARTLQRSLLQDGSISGCHGSGADSNSSGSNSSARQRPCTTPSDGGRSDMFVQICGDRSACSVLLVSIGVIVLLVIFACGLGGLCSRRREQREADDAEEQPPGPTGAHTIGLVDHHSGLPDAECESVRAMSPEKQAELEVRPVREGDEAWGGRQECSICLESVAADASGAWMVFPCRPIHHGACHACVADLVRCNHRPDRRVVHCPLCRCLALVPPACLPPGTMAADHPAQAAAGRSGQAAMRPLGDGSWRLFWIV